LAHKVISGLYVIIDPDACRGRSVIDVARMALAGGASIVQWRDKRRGEREQLDDARALAGLCREYGAIFIVNDHPDLALASEADGVHLGQDDRPIADVRPLVGNAMVIGVSTNNAAEARLAEVAGADYVAVGAIFPTASKAVTRAASLERLREVKSAVHVPVVAIGGINASNIASVVAAGADAAAVISAVCAADDPRAAAAELAAAFGTQSTTR
jgi:thiamine-phosphate diphosphorylase